jgi:7-carboxy-7-deazaguanine synthase
MQRLGIHSIYKATEGEGVFIGTPQIFVRFQGCTIGCLNCDSKETWEFSEDTRSMESVLEEVEDIAGQYPHRLKRVSITGGDPLHPKHTNGVFELIRELKKRGYFVNIEAAGTRVVDEIFDNLDFISMDYKTPSTGVNTNRELLVRLVKQYPGKFQIKSVVADKRDFEATFDAFNYVQEKTNHGMLNWVVTPCYEPGENFPQERFLSIIEMNEKFGGPFRIIGQQHKWIHGPDKRNI